MEKIKIGNFISECRKEKKLTQEQLAEKMDVSVNAVSKWERGLNLPDISKMPELCNILEITINELLEGKKLNENEQKKLSDKNILSILITRNQLENMQILTEILIFAGIVITMTLTSLLTTTMIQKIIVILIGCFIWGYGILLRVKLRKAINEMNLECDVMKKEKIFRILTFIFMILTFIGAGYVLSNKGQVNAGYAIIPSLFCAIFSQLAVYEKFKKEKKNSNLYL